MTSTEFALRFIGWCIAYMVFHYITNELSWRERVAAVCAAGILVYAFR